MSRRELFLSHSAADIDLAQYLEDVARQAIPDLDVFRTTRVGGLPTGKNWFNQITKHLRSADCFLVVLTHASMAKPWVCFETGAAWFSGKPLVPVLGSGLSADDVPEPLRLLQLLSLDDPAQASQAFHDLGGELKDPSAFVRRAQELAGRGRSKFALERFPGIQHDGSHYAFDGLLEELPTGDAVPMPPGLPEAFREAGFDTVFSNPVHPEATLEAGYVRVWRIDAGQRKRPLLNPRHQQLYARKRMSPDCKGGA